MEPLPLPSHIHYELLLQLLERQTITATYQNPALKEQTRQLIVTLRKALAQQKQIEAMCQLSHRISLVSQPRPQASPAQPNFLPSLALLVQQLPRK